MTEIVEVPPDVERIVEGLRDTGYDFNMAVADIIDNSIAAGATIIDVRIAADFSGQLVLCVGDNGCGMTRDGLINAMKYGSQRRADPSSLGKFGLGLKTASTAFCRRLVVVSRAEKGGPAFQAVWDLDQMAKSSKWGLEVGPPATAEVDLLNQVTNGLPGTIVLWANVDRLLNEIKKKGGKAFANAISKMATELKSHIGMVYQRFLDPNDSRARNVDIRVNNERVTAWDPFCIAETKKASVEQQQKIVLPSGETTVLTIRAFILPRKEEFNSGENRALAKISNELQGVYVYRENRLIHGPDWMGMFRQEPHFSLIRVELSFGYQLDDAFQVDIKKSRILLNPDLYDWLREKFLAAPRREAETRYRKGAAATAMGAAALLHAASNNAIDQRVAMLEQSRITASDNSSGNVALENNTGQSSATLRIVVPETPGSIHIATDKTLDNGVLWEASLIDGRSGVVLNTAHPYYTKAYLPNKTNSPLIQSLDFLLWALAQAELNNISDSNREAFEEFRIEVSRNLKKLVADLPDPVEDEDE